MLLVWEQVIRPSCTKCFPFLRGMKYLHCSRHHGTEPTDLAQFLPSSLTLDHHPLSLITLPHSSLILSSTNIHTQVSLFPWVSVLEDSRVHKTYTECICMLFSYQSVFCFRIPYGKIYFLSLDGICKFWSLHTCEFIVRLNPDKLITIEKYFKQNIYLLHLTYQA